MENVLQSDEMIIQTQIDNGFKIFQSSETNHIGGQ